jgi:hypothetical protein
MRHMMKSRFAFAYHVFDSAVLDNQDEFAPSITQHTERQEEILEDSPLVNKIKASLEGYGIYTING